MSGTTTSSSQSPTVDFDAFFAEVDAVSAKAAAAEKEALRKKLSKRAVPIGQTEEPPPRSFLVEDWIPEGFTTMLFGHGGSGKSYLAKRLALSIIQGEPFFGRAVKQGSVLWVDAEDLGQEEIERRTWQVARGMGSERPPEGLYYYPVQRALNHPAVAQEIKAIVETYGIVLVVLDSLSAGAIGLDVSSSQDAVGLMRGLLGWGTTVLALDHVSKRAAAGETSASAFGSAFKHNLVRSSLGLAPAKGGKDVLRMDHHKANFARKSDPVHYVVEFEEGGTDFKPTVRFSTVDAPDVPEGESKRDTASVTMDTLRDLYAKSREPVPVQVIADQRGLAPQTISNHLTKLASRGLAESHSGAWAPVGGQPVLSLLPGPLGEQGGKEAQETPLAAAA